MAALRPRLRARPRWAPLAANVTLVSPAAGLPSPRVRGALVPPTRQLTPVDVLQGVLASTLHASKWTRTRDKGRPPLTAQAGLRPRKEMLPAREVVWAGEVGVRPVTGQIYTLDT